MARRVLPLSLGSDVVRAIHRLARRPHLVIVLTRDPGPLGALKRAACREAYGEGFALFFAHPRSVTLPDVRPWESFTYPDRMDGQLRRIRRHVEAQIMRETDRFILSDDDPGSTVAGRYVAEMPRLMLRNAANGCGVSRLASTSLERALLWSAAFYLGSRHGVAYVGLNASAQPTGSRTDRTFTRYLTHPVQRDAPVTGAAGVLRPVRHLVRRSVRGVHQEWAAASAAAIELGYGTLILRCCIATFAVNPPTDAAADLSTLARAYSRVVLAGANCARGRSNGDKTGCIPRFATSHTLDPQQI
jgi:hypothetical protein